MRPLPFLLAVATALLAPLRAPGADAVEVVAVSSSDADPEVVVVGGDRSYPPYEYLDEAGQPAGYNVELTRAIARVMGLKVEIRLGRWADMRKALEDGELDVLQGISFSEERARAVEFTPPHTIVHHSIFARRGSPAAASLADLKGKRVLVLRGGIMHETLLRAHPEVVPVPADTHADVLRELAAGRQDYAVMAKVPGLHLVRELRLSNLTAIGDPVSAERYGFAVAAGRTALAARLSEGLAVLKNTGEYQRIYDTWLGVLEPRSVTWGQVFRYGAVIVVPLVLLLGGMAAWSRTLQREVDARTAELTREVAERKQAEEELRRNQQQLVQADKMAALGVLVSGVAHEINNPNGLISLDLQVLGDVLRDAEPVLEEHYARHGDFTLGNLRWSRLREAIPRMVGEALDASRRVSRIVEDLKDFARQGDPGLRDGVALNDVVDATVRLARNHLEKSTARFELDCAPGLPPVRGNPQRIEQVLVNLLVNACQALPDRDRAIRVRTFLDARARAVCVEVADEGVGIAPAHLPRLTDPFFTTKRESGGTGLGLAVSAGIVKEHGGALSFSSELGRGTVARLSLPLAAEERTA
jgi:polar amino acid transport system substrate-binding protein